MFEIPHIQSIREYMSNYPAEFRPKNIAIFTNESDNRVYLRNNYEKVIYNYKIKEYIILKLSEEEFFKTMLDNFDISND